MREWARSDGPQLLFPLQQPWDWQIHWDTRGNGTNKYANHEVVLTRRSSISSSSSHQPTTTSPRHLNFSITFFWGKIWSSRRVKKKNGVRDGAHHDSSNVVNCFFIEKHCRLITHACVAHLKRQNQSGKPETHTTLA